MTDRQENLIPGQRCYDSLRRSIRPCESLPVSWSRTAHMAVGRCRAPGVGAGGHRRRVAADGAAAPGP